MKKNTYPIDCTSCQNMATSAFCTLKSSEFILVNRHKVTNYVSKGYTLFNENDAVRGLHCVHEGKVKLYKTLNDGTLQILRIAKGSDLIGYRGLLGNGKYISSAQTIEDSVICFIPKEKIFDLIAKNIQFSLGLMSKIAADISDAENKAINFLQKSSRERLAEALLLLEKSFGVTEDGFIDIRLTREEISEFTGMTVETAIRALRSWENEGLLALDKRQKIKLLDKPKLLEISNATE